MTPQAIHLTAGALLAGCAVTATACFGRRDLVDWKRPGHSGWETVAAFPDELVTALTASPDGALFASTTRALYRSDVSDDRSWNEIVDYTDLYARYVRADFRKMYAPSASEIFLVTDANVFRWKEGRGVGDTIPPDIRARMVDVWGRNGSDVYAVGWAATLVHFDGQAWALQSNPLLEGPIESPYIYRLRAVTGDGDNLYITNGGNVFRRQAGEWETIERPEDERCGLYSLAVHEGTLLAAGGEHVCLWQYRDSSWRVLIPSSRGRWDWLFYSQPQPAGTVLFYSNKASRPVYEFDGERIRAYVLPDGFGGYGAAAAVGNYLYFARTQDDDAVILRIGRDVIEQY